MRWYKMSQRKSTVTSQPSAIHVFTSTKQATCEPRAVSSPPTHFTPRLSLPEWTSATPRWNKSLLAFQRKVKHESKNKTEWESWAFWSSSNTARFRATDGRDTLCSYTACLSKIHCKQTVHWLDLWKPWSVRAEEMGKKESCSEVHGRRRDWKHSCGNAAGCEDARQTSHTPSLPLTLPHSLSYWLLTMCVNRGRTRYSNLRLLPKMPKNSSQSGACCSRGWRHRGSSLVSRCTK